MTEGYEYKDYGKVTNMIFNNTDALKKEYELWLHKYRWNWFVTQKIEKGRPSRHYAIELWNQWIGELAQAEGSSRFRWFRVLESGRQGDHLHFHSVVGGFRNRMAHWGRRWEQLGGDAMIDIYDPERGGLWYMLKTMKSSGELDIEFHLPKKEKK